MTRDFVIIWATAFAIAAAGIVTLLTIDDESKVDYSPSVASAEHFKILFIGSSLTKSALPEKDPPRGILGDDRAADIRYVFNIPERISNTLLGEAIDSGAETVFLEINAYAQHYVPLLEPRFLWPIIVELRETSVRLRYVIKRMLGLPHRSRTVWRERSATNQTLDTRKIETNELYKLVAIEPSYPEDLQLLLKRARAADVEVFFFSPPRPQSIASAMEEEAFTALNAHIRHIAALYDVPLWASPDAWPDDHFMDIEAHANELGRQRFQQALAEWYGARL